MFFKKIIKEIFTAIKKFFDKYKYRVASNKWLTIAAVTFEVLMLIGVILLGDSLAKNYFELPTPLAQHVPLNWALIAVLVIQYCIVFTELVARYRDEQKGITIPIALLPGGILLRAGIMFVLASLVIAFKLLVYFVAVLLAFVFQILQIDRFRGPAFFIDFLTDETDAVLESAEYVVNTIYNLLYFHKINANSSVFTSIFNGSLSFWCINH
ncbi:MAG: hypothetical protein J6A01_01490 [Proteobacteria bacterium]|nr:hypothetical protein [Pseudomonadota bacterium]